jgi:hypothetical protein
VLGGCALAWWGEAPERPNRTIEAAATHLAGERYWAVKCAEPWCTARPRLGTLLEPAHLIEWETACDLALTMGLSGASPHQSLLTYHFTKELARLLIPVG